MRFFNGATEPRFECSRGRLASVKKRQKNNPRRISPTGICLSANADKPMPRILFSNSFLQSSKLWSVKTLQHLPNATKLALKSPLKFRQSLTLRVSARNSQNLCPTIWAWVLVDVPHLQFLKRDIHFTIPFGIVVGKNNRGVGIHQLHQRANRHGFVIATEDLFPPPIGFTGPHFFPQ